MVEVNNYTNNACNHREHVTVAIDIIVILIAFVIFNLIASPQSCACDNY